jgi:predicted permease
MAQILFSIIAPVLLCCAVGYFWQRSGRGLDVGAITSLVTVIGAPCLVFHIVANLTIDPVALTTMAWAMLSVLFLLGVVGFIALWALGMPRQAHLAAIVFPNIGNMGIPLNYLAFGDEGLQFAVAIFAVTSLVMFTAGAAIISGTVSLKSLIRVPLIFALLPALGFVATGRVPPDWVNATTELLGGMTIPLMLLMLGASLARLGVGNVWQSFQLALLRTGLGFLAGIAVAEAFGMSGTARGVLIIQAAMPVAVFSYLFAERFQAHPKEIAGAVVVSSLLSIVTLPPLLWYVL